MDKIKIIKSDYCAIALGFIYWVGLLNFNPVLTVLAHEGHDKTPGAIAAPHGGVVQGTHSLYWELVSESEGVKLYPLTHEIIPIDPKEITLSGMATFPKKRKSESMTFKTESDCFSGNIDAKGAHRYTLELSFTYHGKKEKVKFQVEPHS